MIRGLIRAAVSKGGGQSKGTPPAAVVVVVVQGGSNNAHTGDTFTPGIYYWLPNKLLKRHRRSRLLQPPLQTSWSGLTAEPPGPRRSAACASRQ